MSVQPLKRLFNHSVRSVPASSFRAYGGFTSHIDQSTDKLLSHSASQKKTLLQLICMFFSTFNKNVPVDSDGSCGMKCRCSGVNQGTSSGPSLQISSDICLPDRPIINYSFIIIIIIFVVFRQLDLQPAHWALPECSYDQFTPARCNKENCKHTFG